MLRNFLSMVHRVPWILLLLLLLRGAVATTVEDTDPSIRWDGAWIKDDNTSNSGGCAQHTNMTGATATFSFTGTAVSLYGLANDSGANFSFSINNGPSQSCTARKNGYGGYGGGFKTKLCTIPELDGTAQHMLTVTHTDLGGCWLPLDFLDVTFSNASSSVTPSDTSTSSLAVSTTTSTSTPQTTSQTPISGARKPSSNVGAIAGGVVGGIAGLTFICVGAFIVMRYRRTRRQPMTPYFSELRGPPSLAASPGAGVHDSPNTGPSPKRLVSDIVVGNTSAAPFRPEAMVGPASSYQPYTLSPDTSMTANNSFALFPPPALHSTIERTPSQTLPSSDTRGEGSSSLYPAGVASFAASNGRPSAHRPLPEDSFASPPPVAANSRGVEPSNHTQSDFDSWRSVAGSPAPPSYHTRVTH